MATFGLPKRRVFFSFHYQRDIWRVNQVRLAGVVDPQAAAGWSDAGLWEAARTQGDAAIERLIDRALEGTTVTVVMIGAKTAERRFVKYEIERSLARGNGLLGVRIHRLTRPHEGPDTRGAAPSALVEANAKIYDYDRARFGEWVQTAFEDR
jgi:hypothetical protein